MKIYIVTVTSGQEYSEGYMEDTEIWRAFKSVLDADKYIENPDEEGKKRLKSGCNTEFRIEEVELL